MPFGYLTSCSSISCNKSLRSGDSLHNRANSSGVFGTRDSKPGLGKRAVGSTINSTKDYDGPVTAVRKSAVVCRSRQSHP